MKLVVNFINAFTDVLFKGNSAAVIVLPQWIDDELMQSIACENNLSETAFVVNQSGINHIRWFSPLSEIDFCGHATLASSYVLFEQNGDVNELRFYAKAVGEFSVALKEDGLIEMDFPNRAPNELVDIPQNLLKGLSIKPDEVFISQQAYFAVYENEHDVIAVEQTQHLLKTLAPLDVVVTAASQSDQYDFISRYFWPANGGDEDPVTGSIHAGLAPFWAQRLGKSELVAYQASQRGGLLFCKVAGERVKISGNAVKYLQGEIFVG
jgi:PhzF family phenazine biosynthesis protein